MAKSTGKSKRREAPTRPLAAIPAAELAAELRRRERRVQMLVRRYETLMGRAAKLRQEIATLGGTIGRSARRHRRSSQPVTAPPRPPSGRS